MFVVSTDRARVIAHSTYLALRLPPLVAQANAVQLPEFLVFFTACSSIEELEAAFYASFDDLSFEGKVLMYRDLDAAKARLGL